MAEPLLARDIRPSRGGRRLERPILAALAILLIPRLVGAVATHPLDALDAAEITATVALLRDSGKAGDGTLFASLTLREPPKSVVLAWEAGQEIPRSAVAVLRRDGKTYEAVVDLRSRAIISFREIPGAQPFVTLPEILSAIKVTLADTRMQEGLRRRGLTDLEALFCAPRTVGNFGRSEEATRRLAKVDCFDIRDIKTDVWARPIEGLFATVDLDRHEVLDVTDLGVVPVPSGNSEADAAPAGESGAQDRETEEKKKEKKPAGREVRWSLPILSPDGTRAVSAVRAADNKERWLVLVDPATGKGRVLDRQHDPAWVREGFAQPVGPSFGWVDDRTLWFVSEATGYSHLYTIDAGAETAAPKALTSGAWEIEDVQLSPRRDRFYLTTTEADAGERHLYALAVTGGARQRLTTTPGAHRVEVSPDETNFADVYSNGRTPPEVFLTAALPGGANRQVTISTSAAFRRHAWIDPPVVRFTARDGVSVPARLYTPESVGARPDPRRPAVVFTHGAGYLQNAHRYWLSYYREYMFHHLLASRGYVVLDVDYRGSAGYGRDWRTAIAGFMGGKDLDDIVDAAGYLVREHGVDPRRIGVYGGSYGGFLTLMALFTSPDTFAAGAALRPVTDWAHYEHPYTSNILGVPPRDTEAYRKSSPIYHAAGLKGALLICHGMVDTNAHFQDSVRLAQRLIELRKENWELAAYPVENHGFEQATSWADEYKRILALFERTLRVAPAP